MKFRLPALRTNRRLIIAVSAVAFVMASGTGYTWYFADRIAPNTWVGVVDVGGLTQEEAADRLIGAIEAMDHSGIGLMVGERADTIQTAAIGLDLNLAAAIESSFAHGHQGSAMRRVWDRISALARHRRLTAPIVVDKAALERRVDEVADVHERGRRDIRLQVEGTHATLLTDTEPGKIIDRAQAVGRIAEAAGQLDAHTIVLEMHDDPPRTDSATAPDAVAAAQRMMGRTLVLVYEDLQYTISRDRIGSWVVSEYDHDQLLAGLDRELIGKYVTGIAGLVNVEPKPPVITTENGKVTGFSPPEVGLVVQEDELSGMIWDALVARAADKQAPTTLTIPTKAARLALAGLDNGSGITELIGKATTTFTGSPKNRISNIKNGVKHLAGSLIEPGAEFSTLGTLGTIDDTTGYLPELVIKGDRTTPEFGGGLCQVSTTLFRAVMDAGLPVTARQNHSFRVSYYEKDGNGKPIGPGLDATIYEPNTDFKFRNDTAHPILIIGYVVGDKITFEFYGTGDGRTSAIIGPKVLTERPAPPDKYIETLDLAPGVIKQVENPHPGGSAIAQYTITYPDGRTHYQEFMSWYRPWPAVFLQGVSQLSSPSPTPPVSPPLP